MLRPIFTLDYEIHGNGDGSPHTLMVEPTARLMDLLDRYGAKLTIMADVAEILKFGEYKVQIGRDDYHYDSIVTQLAEATRRGHDVQLHLHCSYFNARHEGGRWIQDWSEYNFAGLSDERIDEVVCLGKSFLEQHLRQVNPSYRCYAFRAANWAVSPSRGVVRALVKNGIAVDTSVFKFGKRSGLVTFDYTDAHSALQPWRVSEDDICRMDDTGRMWEVPIYSEQRPIWAFASVHRLQRVMLSRKHKLDPTGPASGPSQGAFWSTPWRKVQRAVTALVRRHAWKADFNVCSGRRLFNALLRAEATYGDQGDLPFVLIGHSKIFDRRNEATLETFLKRVSDHPDRFRFGRFDDLSLASPAAA